MKGVVKGAVKAQKVVGVNEKASTLGMQGAAVQGAAVQDTAVQGAAQVADMKGKGVPKTTKADIEMMPMIHVDEYQEEEGQSASEDLNEVELNTKFILNAAIEARGKAQSASGAIPDSTEELSMLAALNCLEKACEKEEAKDSEVWKSLVRKQSLTLRSSGILDEEIERLRSQNSPSKKLINSTFDDARKEMARRNAGVGGKIAHHAREMGGLMSKMNLPGAILYPVFTAMPTERAPDADHSTRLSGRFTVRDLTGPNMTAEQKDELGTLLFMDTVRGLGLQDFVANINDSFAENDFGTTRDFMESEPSMNHLIDFVRHNYADECKFEIDQTEEPQFVQDARKLLDAICLETNEFAWRIRGIASAIIYTYSKNKIHTLSANAKKQIITAEEPSPEFDIESQTLINALGHEVRDGNPEDRYKVECDKHSDDVYGGKEVEDLRHDCEDIVVSWELETSATKNNFKTIGQDVLEDVKRNLNTKMLDEDTKMDRFMRKCGDVLSFAVDHEKPALLSYATVSIGVILARVVAERESAQLLGGYISKLSDIKLAMERSLSALSVMATGSPAANASLPNSGDVEAVTTAIIEATNNANASGLQQTNWMNALSGIVRNASAQAGITFDNAVSYVTDGLSDHLGAASRITSSDAANFTSAAVSGAGGASGLAENIRSANQTSSMLLEEMQSDLDTGLIARRADVFSGFDRVLHSGIALYLIVGYCIEAKRSRDRGTFAAANTVSVLESMSKTGLISPELYEEFQRNAPLCIESERYAENILLTCAGAMRGGVNGAFAVVDVAPDQKHIYGTPLGFRIAGGAGVLEELIRMMLLGGDRLNLSIMKRLGEMVAKGEEVGEKHKRFVRLSLYSIFKNAQSATPGFVRSQISRLTGGTAYIDDVIKACDTLKREIVDKYNALINPEERLTLETFEEGAVSEEERKALSREDAISYIVAAFLGFGTLAAQYTLYGLDQHLMVKLGGALNSVRLVTMLHTGIRQSRINEYITGKGFGTLGAMDPVVGDCQNGNTTRMALCEVFGQAMEIVNMAIVLTGLGIAEQGVSVFGDQVAGKAQLANEMELSQARIRYLLERFIMGKVERKYNPTDYPRLCHVYQEAYQELSVEGKKSEVCPELKTKHEKSLEQVRRRVVDSAEPKPNKLSVSDMEKERERLEKLKMEIQEQLDILNMREKHELKTDSRRSSVVDRLNAIKSESSKHLSSEIETEPASSECRESVAEANTVYTEESETEKDMTKQRFLNKSKKLPPRTDDSRNDSIYTGRMIAKQKRKNDIDRQEFMSRGTSQSSQSFIR